MTYLFWALLLVIQNASFTMISRARNSGSDWYHGIASVFSNGIWFLTFVFTFDFLSTARDSEDAMQLLILAIIYIPATVFGSVVAGKLLRKYIEKGNRKVGAYMEGEGQAAPRHWLTPWRKRTTPDPWDGADLRGQLAICSKGILGKIEGRQEMAWGWSWIGTTVEIFRSTERVQANPGGEAWASQNPQIITPYNEPTIPMGNLPWPRKPIIVSEK